MEFPEITEHALSPRTELRFELEHSETLALRIKQGKAEIFGAELALARWYAFSEGCKAAVYTFEGCDAWRQSRHHLPILTSILSRPYIQGSPSTLYTSEETPLTSHTSIHLYLERLRILAQRELPPISAGQEDDGTRGWGPRVLVLGGEGSGKTTLCKTLLNWSVRSGKDWEVVYVNLDPRNGTSTVPGALTATPISAPLPTSTPVRPLGSTSTTGPSALPSGAQIPLSVWYGHEEVSRNVRGWEGAVKGVGSWVGERLGGDRKARTSGLVIDTPYSISEGASSTLPGAEKYSLIRSCVDAFGVNVILIIGAEKLYIELSRMFASNTGSNGLISVVKVPKSGGTVLVPSTFHNTIQSGQIKSYFYGSSGLPPPSGSAQPAVTGNEVELVRWDEKEGEGAEVALSPYGVVVGFDEIEIYRVGQDSLAPSSALPIGFSRVLSPTQLVRLDPSSAADAPRLMHAVLALMRAPSRPGSSVVKGEGSTVKGEEGVEDTTERETEEWEKDVVVAPIMGYLLISAIDQTKRRMTILSPSAGRLPGKVALIGSFDWQDA